MADAPKPEIPATVKVVQDIPVIYSDGILSHSFANGVSKLYFARNDPDPYVTGPAKETIIVQLVMPNESLVRTVTFLEHRLDQMVKNKTLDQAVVDESRRFWVENPDA